MTDKILCPWCGAKMSYRPLDHINGFYDCPQCLASGPAGRGEADARESALRRYTPPLKPMTLEEIETNVQKMPDAIPLWTEDKTGCFDEKWVPPETMWQILQMEANIAQYNKTWRCWSRKPTDEERSAAEWET